MRICLECKDVLPISRWWLSFCYECLPPQLDPEKSIVYNNSDPTKPTFFVKEEEKK